MPELQQLPLVLGGHSFIEQLGSDPAADERMQIDIVGKCLDQGITWFDTTYLPERVALGRALHALGRRAEATIIAWNFFVDFRSGQEVGGPAAYQSHHLEQMLQELRCDHIDCLVVHGVEDAEENARQLELVQAWQRAGHVGRLGEWYPPADADTARAGSPFSFMVHPFNVTTPDVEQTFAACRKLGWTTLACSPFVRGWELDKLAERAGTHEDAEASALRARLADHMLRYSLFDSAADRLIVAMRRSDWIARNVASVRRGPLQADERAWLESLL